MKNEKLGSLISRLIDEVENLIPNYLNDPIDFQITNGNVSICIITEDGEVTGKMFGTNKITMRRTYNTAWTKASQVWITRMKTGEYEKKVFNNEVDDSIYGISKPDMIGWDGGQPITLSDGTKLSVGFSGFRGTTDLEIVLKAVSAMESDK